MAPDEEQRRLFVGCRTPAQLLDVDTELGTSVASSPRCDDADHVHHDASRKRVFCVRRRSMHQRVLTKQRLSKRLIKQRFDGRWIASVVLRTRYGLVVSRRSQGLRPGSRGRQTPRGTMTCTSPRRISATLREGVAAARQFTNEKQTCPGDDGLGVILAAQAVNVRETATDKRRAELRMNTSSETT